MKNLTVIDHPLIEHNLVRLRDENTQPEEFRRAVGEVATLMVYEATRTFEQKNVTVQTPITKTRAKQLKREVLLVPVLRAGLGMLEPLLRLIPHARVGFIGLKRNEDTLAAATYHKSLPEKLGNFEVIVMDPMLATGGSAVSAIKLLHERGAKRVRLVNLLAAPEGVKFVHKHFPDVPIFTGTMDKKLNSKGYIVPGLGDAGDRLFGV
ncbi:MAG: uracil phosphoribosyltransferase [Verrucomicrobiales bacterium]|nr:uracil phosphoribosyltransferase [Verrucomicrobiales bacterium]|tara:strand:- start:16195 stop:16818 length:624 start_codon:yes stop_codon:yes gene_type:complete